MNGRQIRTWAALVAGIALYQGAGAASKYLVSDAEVRKTYADSMNVDPITLEPTETGAAFFAAGVGNRDFAVVLEYPSQTQCDAYLDFVAQDQAFLQSLTAAGFKNVVCVREDGGKYTREVRAITRKSPAKPQPAPPVSPAPRAVPHKHIPATSVAVSIA
jgi:hypothetical protein